MAGTEAIAYDFLAKGGKHSRPFITLAVYDALTGGKCTLGGSATDAGGATCGRAARCGQTRGALDRDISQSLAGARRIEDDDGFRYGDQTLHRRYGMPTAINVGDYLIGWATGW